MTEQRKAVALISGGLDSMLAARVIMDQGVHVEGLNFFTGFCVEGHTHFKGCYHSVAHLLMLVVRVVVGLPLSYHGHERGVLGDSGQDRA